jgi:tight adherence protein C
MALPPGLGTPVLATALASLALLLAVVAAMIIARLAESRDLAQRMRGVVHPSERRGAAARGTRRVGSALLRPVLALGEVARRTAIVSEKDIGEFQKALAAAGFDAARGVHAFVGCKAALLVVLPLGAFAYVSLAPVSMMTAAMVVAGALVLAVLGPNYVLTFLRRPFQNRLRKGLPDALDLLVVAAEAGLGLETAIDRVAREMEGSNRAIALELNILLQELRMLPDRRLALERMAERTDIEGFKRLGATLSQTLRYGTPLAQALRILAGELRTERMLRLEEKAIRLPALLVGPLILFILPALFIALVGPSVLEIGRTFGGTP